MKQIIVLRDGVYALRPCSPKEVSGMVRANGFNCTAEFILHQEGWYSDVDVAGKIFDSHALPRRGNRLTGINPTGPTMEPLKAQSNGPKPGGRKRTAEERKAASDRARSVWKERKAANREGCDE